MLGDTWYVALVSKYHGVNYSEGDVELSDIGLSLLVERVGTSAWEICLIFLLPEINGFVIRFGI